jgi:hypothetical protein
LRLLFFLTLLLLRDARRFDLPALSFFFKALRFGLRLLPSFVFLGSASGFSFLLEPALLFDALSRYRRSGRCQPLARRL